MRLPIHREGIFPTAILTLLAFLTAKICRWGAYFFAFLASFTAFFFRDPEREIPTGEDLIVSPADGTVLSVETIEDVPYLEGPQHKISIFLSIFNVHINRSPIEGKIIHRLYNAGKFFPANAPKASLDNEQNTLVIDHNGFRVMVKQIAGIIARRIVCWVDPGMNLQRGERFGLIRFGSRTELFLPLSAKIIVGKGDCVKGGETIIGKRS